MELRRKVSGGSALLALACLAACTTPEDGRAPRLGLAASVLPNVGFETQGSVLLQRRPAVDWRLEASVAQQFLDDKDFAADGNPPAGDFTQVGLSLRAITAGADRLHFTFRCGPVWMRARSNPNILKEPGDYLGLRVGIGFETDLTSRWSFGPEIAVVAVYGEGDFEVVPQVTWGVRWRL